MGKISVRWDIGDYPVSKEVIADLHSIAQTIRSALQTSVVSVDVLGDAEVLPKADLQLEPRHGDKPVHASSCARLKEINNAFRSLKADHLMPTLRNLEEWSRFMGGQKDIGGLLSQAVEMELIAKVKVPPGKSLVYLPLDTQLWHCVDLNDTQQTYCGMSWKRMRNYLLDDMEWNLFSKSQSRYEAAQILKKSGIPIISGYSVAEILHFFNLLKNRNWISFHKNKWLPLTRNLEWIPSSGKVGNNPTKERERKAMPKFTSPEEQTMWILRSWITKKVRRNDGYDISLIRRDFLLDTGLRLDLESLGYKSLRAFIFEELSDVVTLKPSVRYKNVWKIWQTPVKCS